MALTNNHITYTAEDLLSYAQRKMTPQQMHALEKATMEDPFLAEALDGYIDAVRSINIEKETSIIGQKLEAFKGKIGSEEKKEEPARIVPIWRQKWLQYAVAASVLLAGGWWVLSLNKITVTENNVVIAQNEAITTPIPDSTTTLKSDENLIDTKNDNQNQSAYKILPERDIVVKKEKPIAAPGLAVEEPTANAPVVADLLKDKLNAKDNTASAGNAKFKTSVTPPQALKDQTNNEVYNGRGAVTQNDVAEIKADNFAKSNTGNFANSRRFTFNGKVVDANNNPLPFSNVTVPGEGVGTYSDAKGNFNFVYVDSALPVRARSLGYEEKTYTMQPDIKENRIVLLEDENLKRELVINRQEKQARNQVYNPMIVETDSLKSVEPSVGWSNYNIYALNNSRAIELPVKRSVELSFDIGKTGEVENITVDKSSGKELDEEAIRLIKEGPKWKKKKGTKSRAKVILKF